MVNSVSGNYDSWVASLNSRGIKTTSLGGGEANFADYTNALSESLKQEIMASFDNDADYDLQAKLASLYSGNVMQSGDIISAAKAAGIQVDVQYVNTSYIVDNKKGGQYANNKNATNGSIAVYTFKDANGGEIKIADANGNGALETEELFMNELLSGVVSDISAGSSGGAGSVQNNMQNQIDALLEQMQKQIEEQQKRIQEQEEALRKMSEDDDIETTVNKDDSEIKNEKNTDEIEKEAEKYIRNNYPELSETQILNYAEDIAEKISDTGISMEKAVKAVMGELENVA